MAEFDTSEFSAVAAFFGGSPATEEEPRKVESSAPSNASGRRGVGATAAQSGQREDQVTNNLLRVGKRKHDTDEDGSQARDESDSDDDQEGGRTSIQEKTVRQQVPDADNVAVQVKKKKKAGKKERKMAATAVTDSSVNDTEQDPSTPQVENKQKRKRKKVRSRQKNIYKDKRLAQHKPDHLILGRPNFQGRPLTSETRARLNLPPSKTSQKHRDNEHDNNDVGVGNKLGGMDLAIDSLLDDVGVLDQEAGVANPKQSSRKKKKHKKGKKSKYKNLM